MNINQLLKLSQEEVYNWLQKNKDDIALIAVKTEFGEGLQENIVTPSITDSMKYACMGEHSFSKEYSCDFCNKDEEDEDEDECEVCDGSGTIHEKYIVPWTLTKEIYQDMANISVCDNKRIIPLVKDSEQ
jgi:hypothetical protein